ncbi:UDP-N-acetylmuramate--L-alanine ligase, partial [Pseudoalteromonas sp. S185]
MNFIGFGVSCMCCLAVVIAFEGYRITGSVIAHSAMTERLIKAGAEVFIGHPENNVKDANVVVVSSAIDETDPEIIAPKAAIVPVERR